jgi:hypothetical protein
MLKSSADLLLAAQTEEQRNEDYAQIASSAVSIAVMAALAFLPGLALRLGKRLARKIRGMLPEVGTLLPRAVRAIEAAPIGAATRATPGRLPSGATGAPSVEARAERVASTTPPIAGGAGVARTAPAAPAERAGASTPDVSRAAAAPTARPNPPPAPRAADALPDNVRAFPAERARPPGQGDADMPGEVVEGPWRPRPDEPEPPNAAAAQRPEHEVEELRTGTGDVMYRQTPRVDTSDAPHAMATRPPGTPPGPAPSAGVGTARGTAAPTSRRGGGGGRRRGGAPPGGAPASARDALVQLLGKLNVPDRRIDTITDVEARAILAHPRPPDSQPKAQDVFDYLTYKYTRRRRSTNAPWTYRRWSRSHGLKQRQRAARRARQGPQQPRRRPERRPEPAETESMRAPDDPSERALAEARELMAGPRDAIEAVEEAAETPRLRETIPGTRMDRESSLIMAAGTAMERQKLQLWRRALRRYRVLLKEEFDQLEWLTRIFPGASRPDMIAIGDGRIIVGDIEARFAARHFEKTIEYARRLIAGLPDEFADFVVVAEERFWEAGYGNRTISRTVRGRRR